jgi:hypothetical protein
MNMGDAAGHACVMAMGVRRHIRNCIVERWHGKRGVIEISCNSERHTRAAGFDHAML